MHRRHARQARHERRESGRHVLARVVVADGDQQPGDAVRTDQIRQVAFGAQYRVAEGLLAAGPERIDQPGDPVPASLFDDVDHDLGVTGRADDDDVFHKGLD
ncbi:hypothetical protein CSX04_01052 [Burkholderia cepacia]|nr:hypothetical protein CSX04_01052 [Burkholderia cepacia]